MGWPQTYLWLYLAQWGWNVAYTQRYVALLVQQDLGCKHSRSAALRNVLGKLVCPDRNEAFGLVILPRLFHV